MKTKYVKLPSGRIVEFTPVCAVGDNGEEVQVTSVVGEESTKSAFKKQQADSDSKNREAKGGLEMYFKTRESLKSSARAKIANAAGLTKDELKALFA